MKIRFDLSEKINLDNLVASIEEFSTLNHTWQFDVFMNNNNYCISLRKLDERILISVFEKHDNGNIYGVNYTFFEKFKVVEEIKDRSEFNYSNDDFKQALKDFVLMINCLYYKNTVNILF